MASYSPFGNGTSAAQIGPFSGPGFRIYNPNSAFTAPSSPIHFGSPQYVPQVSRQSQPIQPIQPAQFVSPSEENIETEVRIRQRLVS